MNVTSPVGDVLVSSYRMCNSKIIVLSGKCDSFLNFRKRLIEGFLANFSLVVASAPDYEENEVRKMHFLGVSYSQLRLQRTGMNPASDLFYFFRLVNFIGAQKPDVVFSYNIKPVIYASLAARVVGVAKIYALIPGLGFLFAPNPSVAKKILQRLILPLYRLSLKRVDVLFFQNPDDMATFEDLKLISPNTRVIRVPGSGVGLSEFEFTKPVLSPVRFLFVGRLIRDKGLPEFVEAARLLHSRYGNRVEFNILGPLDTNPAAVKQAQLDEWEREGIINYLGVASDVRPHIRNASVFVLPSFYMEGVPRTILESLSMGRPIVTCNSRGCKETVSDGKNGYLVEPRDTDMLAKCLSRFVESPNLIELMGVESRRIAERDYDVVKVTNQMLDAMNMKTF